jgi:hypothetical protein
MTKYLLISAILLLTAACGSVTIDTGLPADKANRYEEYHDGWGFGFAGQAGANVKDACPSDRIARVRNYFSPEDLLIALITAGIYTPRSTTIICATEEAHAGTTP